MALPSAPDLSRLSLFEGLAPDVLDEIAPTLNAWVVPGGETLFAEGEPADAVYVVLSGAFIASKGQPPAVQRVVGTIAAGETIGEMALLSGRPRSATVRALRDSEVLGFTREEFERLLKRHPNAMLGLARVAYRRLELAMAQSSRPRLPRAIAIVPGGEGVDPWAFAEALQQALARFGRVVVLGERECRSWVSGQYHALESSGATLLYVSEHMNSPWASLCRRQSDAVLVLAVAADTPAEQPGTQLDPFKPLRLVLLHRGNLRPGRARAWLKAFGQVPLHHVRDSEDIARIARLLTGHATALVLSGGGARGFAHLGVVQALREAGLEIDAIGATSIGAVMGAGVASEWGDLELYAAYKRSFVDTNPLSDYTFPFVSLVAGRKASKLLRREFGDIDIEDLPIPFFCISANLTAGKVHVHDRGPLWRALRASIAIPGVLPPVFEGGQVLVDGGVIDNLPIDVMRERHAGRIIGVDIAGEHALKTNVEEANLPSLWRMVWEHVTGRANRPGIVSILLRSGMVNSATTTLLNRAQSSLLISPPVTEIDLMDWRAFDRAIRIGYQHAHALLANLPVGWR